MSLVGILITILIVVIILSAISWVVYNYAPIQPRTKQLIVGGLWIIVAIILLIYFLQGCGYIGDGPHLRHY